MSRRGAVKVNPVTGKMEKLAPDADGTKHRDGSLMVDDRYINAAKELGLGGAEGMYQHIKSLAKVGATDIPYGSSMETEGQKRETVAHKPTLDAKNFDAVKSAVRTSVTQVGRARVAGFGGGSGGGNALHNHDDAFQRRKGVVNTVGGARDVTRKTDEPKLPPRGADGRPVGGARVATFDTMDTHSAEGKARREAIEKRQAAQSKSKQLAEERSGSMSSTTSNAGQRGGPAASLPKSGGGITVIAPAKKPMVPSKVSNSAATTTSHASGIPKASKPAAIGGSGTLGGSSAGAEQSDERNKRAAYFDKLFKEQQAKKAAAAAALNGDD